MTRYLARFFMPLFAALATVCALAGEAILGPDIPTPPDVGVTIDAATIPSYEDRFGRPRPVVAGVGQNAGTELIDFVVHTASLAMRMRQMSGGGQGRVVQGAPCDRPLGDASAART